MYIMNDMKPFFAEFIFGNGTIQVFVLLSALNYGEGYSPGSEMCTIRLLLFLLVDCDELYLFVCKALHLVSFLLFFESKETLLTKENKIIEGYEPKFQ